ncbi:MAG: DUF3226 domain-containing protein [Thermoleophilia bacterium]
MAWTFEKVTSSVVVLGEGRDEAELLGVLAKRLGLEIQCVDCGGSQQFHVRLKVVVKAPGFSQVTSLGVIRDAETDAAGAAASVKNRLRAEGLPVPEGPMQRASATNAPDTAFLIVPSGATTGMMEDLVLRTLADDPSWPCDEAYFECLKSRAIDLDADHEKRRVQVGLAALPSPRLARNIGEAARMGLIPLDHPALSELYGFLELIGR